MRRVKNETWKAIAMLAALVVPAVVAAAPPKKKPGPRPEGFAALRDRYVKAFFARFPVVSTYFGATGLDPALAALDGRLRDYRPDALRSERAEWERTKAALARVNRAGLTEAERVDAEVMGAHLAFLLSNLDRRLEERAL